MRVLVTGAAGFIGSHLVDRLLAREVEVVGLDNFDPFYGRERKEANLALARDRGSFRLVEGDIRDRELLAGLPEVDAVVHLAALAGVRPSLAEPRRYASVNVDGTVALLEMARERGIERFIFASSSSVYGERKTGPFSETDRVDHPISPYAASKKAGELLAHTYAHLHGTAVVCLRLFTVYGPRQRPDLAIHKFARLLRAGETLPVFGDGSSERDYTYVDDLVDGVVGGLEWTEDHPGGYEVVNLGESRTVSLDRMIRVLGEELGVEPRIQRLPEQPGDVSRTLADISRARKLLAYAPETDFREGVRRFVEWLDREG